VIPHQVIGGPCYGHPFGQQPHLQLSQVLFAVAIGVGDERMYENTATDRILERVLNFFSVETEYSDLDTLLRTVNTVNERLNSVIRLNDEFQGRPPSNCNTGLDAKCVMRVARLSWLLRVLEIRLLARTT
jgi:hypothetical protein